MRKLTTFLVSLTFMISGVMVAITSNNVKENSKSISAATLPQPVYVLPSTAELPLDLRLGYNSTIKVKDTLKDMPDTIETPKAIVKKVAKRHKPKMVEPDTIPQSEPKLDTLYVSNPVVIIHRCPICHNDSIEHCSVDEP